MKEALRRQGFEYADLFSPSGLRKLDAAFLADLGSNHPETAARMVRLRESDENPEPVALSELLLAVAPVLERFLVSLLGLETEIEASREEAINEGPVQRFKKDFVLRKARRYRGTITPSFAELDTWLSNQLANARELANTDRELATAQFFEALNASGEDGAEQLALLVQWGRLAMTTPEGQARVNNWSSFTLPNRVDHAHLVPLDSVETNTGARLQSKPEHWRRRDGFALTDKRMETREIQGEVHYCIYCHDHDGDFCSKGFPEKKGEPALGLKPDPLGVILTGCPLDLKISEMHLLKRDGRTIAALAVAMVDNPMIPATGHRICNDCMKGCIYQKSDPVNVPQIETRVLTDVLALPWGVEIYDLLTRWNPLRRTQYLPAGYNGRRVLVAGMGPAGFTMAHHLTQEGCAVVGVDGLKIEPLQEDLLREPVRDWSSLEEPLDDRILLGFGGVAEYGITVRWDKNFLKLIYLSLLRRPLFQVFGGVRLGGTITLEDAWSLGFDHVCMATGAGLPRVVPMGNSLARGMRQASDFLMALQLTGAGKDSSLVNLQVRLPAVVIGGGLTAVDTATEVQSHYLQQVEKVLARYEILALERGESNVLAGLGEEDRETLAEFLDHGRQLRAERERAANAGEPPNFVPLLRSWGGVTLAYRKSINASPAYVRNHEEIIKAMEEGLWYAEGLDPVRVELDRHQHVEGLVCRRMEWGDGRWLATRQEETLPARSVFVAAGASPNTIYEREYPGTLLLENDHFLSHVEHGETLQPVEVALHCKTDELGTFTSYQHDGKRVTFIGDTHPVFHGSVVKAVASAARSYPQLMNSLEHLPSPDPSAENYARFREQMTDLLTARVDRVVAENPGVVELWIRAPLAARRFRPGQFFRLQTFEQGSPVVAHTRLQIPVLTVSGTGVEDDCVRLLVLQWGGAPRLVSRLQPGDPVVLMGPTGAATDIPSGKTVAIVAGSWGAAVMLDIGPALRAAGNRVLYIAALNAATDLDRRAELEASADQIIWCTAQEPTIMPGRTQDCGVVATNMVDLLRRYGSGELDASCGAAGIPLKQVDRIMVMGSTGLLQGFQQALSASGSLRPLVKDGLDALGTVGSPMQCMLKGVCAQCLQWQLDPETGARTRAVFSCAGQDQPLDWIDLDHLAARQSQNRLLDRLTSEWLDYVLTQTEDTVR